MNPTATTTTYDYQGCFTFKTSVDSCQQIEDSQENQENDASVMNLSTQAYSALKASAIAKYQTDIKQMERLINDLTFELESQRQQLQQTNENEELQKLMDENKKLEEEMKYLCLANEDFIKENRDIMEMCSKLEQANQQHKDQIKQLSTDIHRMKQDNDRKDQIIEQLKRKFEEQFAEERKLKYTQNQKEKDFQEISRQILSTNQEIKNKIVEQQTTHKKEIEEMVLQKDKQLNELITKIAKYEFAFKRLLKIVDPKLTKFDEENLEVLLSKIENIDSTNQQIKQRIKILAEVISKQDNSFKNTIMMMTNDINQKDCDIDLLQQQIVTQGKIIADMTKQIEDQRKEFRECYEAVQIMNSECQNYQMQLNILDQEKQNLKNEKRCLEFYVKNLRMFVFCNDALSLLDEVQQTYEKIVNISGLLKNIGQTPQIQDKLKQQEHDLQMMSHKLKVQQRELAELMDLEKQRHSDRQKNEKECLTMARELDFLKQEKELSMRVTRDSVQMSQQGPSSRVRKPIQNPLGKSADNLSYHLSRHNESVSSQQSKGKTSLSQLAQFLSMRSQKNLNQSMQLTIE